MRLPQSSKMRPVRMAGEPLSRTCRATALAASLACTASNRSRSRIGSCSPRCEREVIGERVRDKIAASKRKGIWVGGPVPLGYRCMDKKLFVVPEEVGHLSVPHSGLNHLEDRRIAWSQKR